jgi:hypothetical protein
MQHGPWHNDVPEYAPYASKEALDRDVRLVFQRLLWTNPLKKIDFKPDSPEECEVRRALARLLDAFSGAMVDDDGVLFGSPCGRATFAHAMWIATGVAELIDPDNKIRQYELVRRRRPGRKGVVPRDVNESRDRGIGQLFEQPLALYSHLANRGQKKAAIDDVIKQLGVTRTDVYAALERYKRYKPRQAPPIAPDVMRPLPPLDGPIRPE